MKFVSAGVLAATLTCTAPTYGQDFSPMADFATARGMSTSQSAAMTDVFRHTLGGSARTGSRHRPEGSRAPAGSDVAATSAPLARLQYRSTPATMQAALTAYIDRGRRSDPQAADAAARALAYQDISGIVAPFGLRDGNVADAFTAYAVLGWMIANGETDPSASAVHAVRDQLAVRIVTDPQFSHYDPSTLGEELKLSFVILHSGWQSARRDKTVGTFADGVAAMFAKQGLDVRGVALTQAGFQPRAAALSDR